MNANNEDGFHFLIIIQSEDDDSNDVPQSTEEAAFDLYPKNGKITI
jgi:hypothetical protein